MRFRRRPRRGLSGNAVIINSFSKYFCMTGWRVGWMVVPEPLVRPIDRLQGNLAISVPTLSQIAAEAAFDGRAEMEAVKHGYEENRRILLDGLPKAGLDTFLPVDGAFYLYADVSRFSNDSFDFAKRMLEETHVAATPGRRFRSAARHAVPPLLLRRLGRRDARGGGADRRRGCEALSASAASIAEAHARWLRLPLHDNKAAGGTRWRRHQVCARGCLRRSLSLARCAMLPADATAQGSFPTGRSA